MKLKDNRRMTKYTLAALPVIFDVDARVILCLQIDLDGRNLPGGALERGELPDEVVVYEVLEETGLDVAVNRLAGRTQQ